MSNPTAGGARILLAEDDNDMRRFLVKALQAAGYVVASFDNGLSAYNRLREEPFELLLTDIVMPGGMNGHELARVALLRRPELKTLLTTGFSEVTNGNGASGARHILCKPYRKDELLRCVREALDA